MQYRRPNPEGKTQGISASTYICCIQSEGLVDNYFLAYIVSMDTIRKYILALKNCMNVYPGPQNCISGHEPYKEGLYHIVYSTLYTIATT